MSLCPDKKAGDGLKTVPGLTGHARKTPTVRNLNVQEAL